MSDDVEKPRRKSGTMCPLWRKDVSEVCHTCEWYDELPLEEIDLATRQRTGRNVAGMWGCALKRLPKIARDTVQALDGVQEAVETFRNGVHNANRLSLALQAREGLALLAADQAKALSAPEPRAVNGEDAN